VRESELEAEMRGFLAGALLILATVWAGAAVAADAGAEAFVNGIYKNYTGTGMQALGVPLDSEATVRKYFEPSLAKMILDDQKNAGGEVGALDGDPFIDAQDWEIKNLKVVVADNGPGKATATVTFTNFKEAKTIKLSLVNVGGAWKISDINWGRGTLRGLFTH
jgi:Protein of unknown function (DUF3828)